MGRSVALVSGDLPISAIGEPLAVSGKQFRAGGESVFIKAVTFGPFPVGTFPDEGISQLPAIRDKLGANAIRLYEIPSIDFVHACAENGLWIFLTIPWSHHLDFLHNRQALLEGEKLFVETVRRFRGHPAIGGYFIANEIESTLVRWMGPRRVREELERWIELGRANDPGAFFSYANYPTTEYLLPVNQDFVSFNLYLEDREALGSYLDRLQNLAGNKPLLISEFGSDSHTHGLDGQADMLRWHIQEACHAGVAGTTIFSWSDRWQRGGNVVDDWSFGLTSREGNDKPALSAVADTWSGLSRPAQGVDLPASPKVSVIICTYWGVETLPECLRSLTALEYPDFEIIVVNDGHSKRIEEMAACYENVRHVGVPHGGLGRARNAGAEKAKGEIYVYTDDDCFVPRDWLKWIVQAFLRSDKIGCVGGPNIPPPPVSAKQARIAAAPGSASHVLLSDTLAEHVPGCNLAVTREAFEKIGGFNPIFRVAGDDVDFCWRILDAGYDIAFSAPAFVWHYRRFTYRGYIKQQMGYGRAEARLMPLHMDRFRHFWGAEWKGIVYAPTLHAGGIVYHGRFGYEPFQFLYTPSGTEISHLLFHASWWTLVILAAVGTIWFWPLGYVALGMAGLAFITAWRKAGAVPLRLEYSGYFSRFIIATLILLQGMLRSFARVRLGWRLTAWGRSLRRMMIDLWKNWTKVRWWRADEGMKFWSENGAGRDELLHVILEDGDEWIEDESGNCDLLLNKGKKPRTGLLTVTEYHENGGKMTKVASCRGSESTVFGLALFLIFTCGIVFYVLGIAYAITMMPLLQALPVLGIAALLAVARDLVARYSRSMQAKRRKFIVRCAEKAGLRSL